MKNLFTITAAIILGLSLFVASNAIAFADGTTNCQPIYGGGQSCVTSGNIVINKTVQNPQNGQFVDNLSVNDPRFAPGSTVTFDLTITNNGGSQIDSVTVKDVFPQFVTFQSGPGNFDSNANTLTFTLSNLKANESRTTTIQGKIADTSAFSTNVVCVVNQSIATANNMTSQDNSQFCIEKNAPQPTIVSQPTMTKGGLPIFPSPIVTKTPPTGPESVALLGMIPTGIAGLLLRKKSSK